jgi:hypothetical protein
MNTTVKQVLMKKIANRLSEDAVSASKASSSELNRATHQLAQEVNSMNRAFSVLNKPSLASKK